MSPLTARSAIGMLDESGNVFLDITTVDGGTLTLHLQHPEVTEDSLSRSVRTSRRIQELDVINLLSAKVARAETLLESSRTALTESITRIEELTREETAERRELIRDSIKEFIRGALGGASQAGHE